MSVPDAAVRLWRRLKSTKASRRIVWAWAGMGFDYLNRSIEASSAWRDASDAMPSINQNDEIVSQNSAPARLAAAIIEPFWTVLEKSMLG